MKAGDLNASHLGAKVLIKDNRTDVVVSGTLKGLRHEGQVVQERILTNFGTVPEVTRIRVVLEWVSGTELRTNPDAPAELI